MEPSIRFCASRDGTRLAYATIGRGTALLHVPGSTTNIEFEWNDPEARQWIERIAERHVLVRCQRRGVGASQRDVVDVSLSAQVDDIAAVVDCLGDPPISVLAAYEAAPSAIAYAVQHPEHVSRLVLWAPYVRDRDPDSTAALSELAQRNWRMFLRTWSDLCFPSGPIERQRWYADMVRHSVSAEVMTAYLRFRRKGTYRVRWWTTLIAALVTLICFLYVSSRPLPAGVTNPLFAALAGCAFLLCLFAGVFLTSDSLSEEKREGTLGLLFLSNLLGSDIVLGKFSALALNAFFRVLALLPVMGVPLLLGGVNWTEFSRVVLALLNMLFVSLAAGICVSAFGRAQSAVVAITLIVLVLLVGGLPTLAEFAPHAPLAAARAGLGWSSPLYPFGYAFEQIYVLRPLKFWGTLVASNLVGWLFLALASHTLVQCWQDTGKVGEAPNPGTFSLHRRWGAETKRRELRGQFSLDYVVGLVLGEAPVMHRMVWGALGAWGLILAWNWGASNQGTLAYVGTIAFSFFLKMLVAFQAARFFSESRSSGALELLLCTPVQNSDILRAQWRKLRRLFLWPSIILILMGALSIAFVGGPAIRATGLWLAWPGGPGFEPSVAGVCWLGIRLAADVLAVGWFGMYLAMTLKRPILAPALTILLVLILPSILSWLALASDVLFISWGTTRLQEDFRQVLIRRYQGGAAPSPISAVSAPELAPAH